MKELLLQYANYNIWANRRIIDVMFPLEEAKIDQEITSSFPCLRKTVYHVWSAEYIWLQRLELTEHPVWIETGFTGSFQEACGKWQEVSGSLERFTSKQFDDRAFSHEVQYYSLKKQHFKNKVSDILMHAFNHSTYHRGQLVTMLRQAGVTTIPSTDLSIFVRK